MIDLIFYSIVEVATGFAPNFTTFLVLRALFGIGMGGEWGVGASLAMEKVPGRVARRAVRYSATGLRVRHTCWLPPVISCLFDRWGWRPLFFLGGLPALLALFVRFRVKESEVWQESRQESWAALGPKRRTTLEAVSLSGATDDRHESCLARHARYVSDFSSALLAFRDGKRSLIAGLSMVGAILGGVAIGLISDRFGRRKAIVFADRRHAAHTFVGLCARSSDCGHRRVYDAVFRAGRLGVIPAHLSELSPNQIRGFLPGFAYQCGALVAGSVGTVETHPG